MSSSVPTEPVHLAFISTINSPFGPLSCFESIYHLYSIIASPFCLPVHLSTLLRHNLTTQPLCSLQLFNLAPLSHCIQSIWPVCPLYPVHLPLLSHFKQPTFLLSHYNLPIWPLCPTTCLIIFVSRHNLSIYLSSLIITSQFSISVHYDHPF